MPDMSFYYPGLNFYYPDTGIAYICCPWCRGRGLVWLGASTTVQKVCEPCRGTGQFVERL